MSRQVTVPLHEQGPALWPGYIDEADLRRTWAEVGTPIFTTMYQGDPSGLAGEIIRREFFRYGFASDRSTCYMAVDVAISTKESADETAVAVVNIEPVDYTEDGVALPPMVTVRWVWHGRVGFAEQARVILEAHDYYRPVEVGIEKVAYQAALLQHLQAQAPNLPLTGITHDRDKFSRLLHLGAQYEFGRIQHEPHLRASALEHQLVHLPTGKHDDMADAVEMATRFSGATSAAWMRKPAGAMGSVGR
jgi:predicted phage terminase large subunit-like protein